MKELLFNLDTLQYVDYPKHSAEILISTKQVKSKGIVTRNGIKYIKYRFVNWK